MKHGKLYLAGVVPREEIAFAPVPEFIENGNQVKVVFDFSDGDSDERALRSWIAHSREIVYEGPVKNGKKPCAAFRVDINRGVKGSKIEYVLIRTPSNILKHYEIQWFDDC